MKDQRRNFMPDLNPSRRGLLTGVAAGIALAARPAAASTVTTGEDGIETGMAEVGTAGRTIPGYFARPAGVKNPPVVVVVQEIFGLHSHIQDVCRRLAHSGFMAVSVELYARYGDTSNLESFPEILEIVRKVPDAEVMTDLDAAVGWAAMLGGDVTRLGITGFCWGGRIVWLYAAHRPDLNAGVAWYGRLRGDASELNPQHPLDVVEGLHAPILGLYGGQDKGIPASDVEAMRGALKKAGKPGELHVYPEAQHGFHADYRASYDPSAAADGYQRMIAWFAAKGMG